MNIQIRIITEDNINNLIPLTASKDIEKLTGKKTLRDVHQQNIRNLKESEKNIPRNVPRRKKPPTKTPFFQPGIDEELPGGANIFAPPGINMPVLEESDASKESVESPAASPVYAPSSPQYAPSSPQYAPSEASQDSVVSAQYNPSSLPDESIEIETKGAIGSDEDGAVDEEESSLLTDIVEEKKDESTEEDKQIKLIK
jgi:hypothetical protein